MLRRTTLLLCGLAAASQDQSFRVLTRIVQVPTVVTDKSGRNIDGLLVRDFMVLDNGLPQEITVDDFAAGLPPISLVIAIQNAPDVASFK